jgi:carboxyl-terminal processing protease
MLKKNKIVLIAIFSLLLFAFKAADDYFEISKQMEIFGSVYKTVNRDYVDDVKPGDLMKVGIDAMLASLDPYTNFYTESQAEDAMMMRSGEYGGLGSQSVKRGDYTYITNVYKGFAADKAALKIGDKLLEINGKSFIGKSSEEVGNALRGAPNTKVTLLVERNGEKKLLEIFREEIKVKNVTYFGLVNPEIGYIRLDHFTMGAGAEVKEALLSLKSKGISKVILDLRDNGGGLLHEAVNIVNVFIGGGELVVYSKGRSADASKNYKTLDPATDATIPLVVLVNNRSASASEIVCGAIQDFDRGVVIGENTFGKGLVQNVRPLVYRTQMKVTIAKYYIPSGRCIQELDYSNKSKDGKAQAMPDSLKKKFKTKNGREVLEGGGVQPDIEIKKEDKPEIVGLLEKSYLMFDYATKFASSKESIPSASQFVFTPQMYDEFVQFVKKQKDIQSSETEKQLEQLKVKLKAKPNIESIQSSITAIEKFLYDYKLQEIQKHQTSISQLLAEEIVRRYEYQEGGFIQSFKHDQYILKSLEIFNNSMQYQQILNKK